MVIQPLAAFSHFCFLIGFVAKNGTRFSVPPFNRHAKHAQSHDTVYLVSIAKWKGKRLKRLREVCQDPDVALDEPHAAIQRG